MEDTSHAGGMWSIIAVGAPGFEDLTKTERMEQGIQTSQGAACVVCVSGGRPARRLGLWSQQRFCSVSLYCSNVVGTDGEGHRIVGRYTLKAGPGTWGHRCV